jgi:hypothetical protein
MILVTATLGGITQPINGNGQHITGSITQDVGAIWGFSFEIDPTNAGYDLIQSRKTLIKCINDRTGRVEFYGRVLLSEQKMSSSGAISKTVTCEGLLGYLHDSVQPYKAEELYTLNDFLDMVLANHNEQVEPSKWIFRGAVDVEVADTGNIFKGLQYQTTFDTIKTKLLDVYGGELELVEDADGVLWLNYLKQVGTTRSTPIELGSNMQDASREVSPLNIVTRVIPLGAKLKQTVETSDGGTTEQETGERLTLAGFTTPEGIKMNVPWVDDEEKIEALGVVCGVLDCPDITEQINLYKRVKEYLVNENRVNLSHTLTAIDLRELGHELDGIYCGDSYPVRNKLIDLDEVLRVIKKTIDINASYKGNIVIGEKKATLSSVQANDAEKTNAQLQQMAGFLQAVGNIANATTTQVTTLATNLSYTINGIVAEALAGYVTSSALGEVEERISTAVDLTAAGIRTEFSKSITEMEKTVNGNLSSEFKALKSYIRYFMNDSGQPVIELGASKSDIICRLLNNRLSFVQNDNEAAYISEDKLYVTEATILHR